MSSKTNPATIELPKIQWTARKRKELLELISQKVPYHRYGPVPGALTERCFEKEAKKALPGLAREIQPHNLHVSRVNTAAKNKQHVAHQKAENTARFGTEAEVSALATRLLAME